jgi:hypothetical protein
MKNAVFLEMTPCGSRKNQRFGGMYRLHDQDGELIFLRSVLQLLVNDNIISRSLIIHTLMMEAIRPSEASVLPTAAQRHVPEDSNLHE